MNSQLQELHRLAVAGDADAAVKFAKMCGNLINAEQHLEQLSKSCNQFIDDVFSQFNNHLVISTVGEGSSERKRHKFEYYYLRPFMKQTLKYLAQWLPPGERCNHIHNAHGIQRCLGRVEEGFRYCSDHKWHRDNHPVPRYTQAEVDKITAEEIANMQGKTYARED